MTGSRDVSAALQRYESVARRLTERTVKEFLEEVRTGFEPRPATANYELSHFDDMVQLEGYTVEGAISRVAHQEALTYYAARTFQFDLPPNPSEAEKAGQVYHRPAEELINALPPLLEPPPADSEFVKRRENLREHLRSQAHDKGLSIDPELPQEWIELLNITKGVRGAGIPFFSNFWQVFTPDCYGLDSFWLSRVADDAGLEVALSWQIGYEEQWISVFYAYCRPKGSDQAYKWRILQRRDYEHAHFESLTAYLDDTSAFVEEQLNADSRLRHCGNWSGNYGDFNLDQHHLGY